MTHSHAEIRALLQLHGLSPSRALGQNFVGDANTVRRIARLAEVVAPPGTVAALRATRKTLADEPASGRRPTIPWLRANLLKTIDTAVAGAFSRIDAGSAGARIEETFTAVQRASLCRSDR